MESGKKVFIYLVLFYVFYYSLFFIMKLFDFQDKIIAIITIIIPIVFIVCINYFIDKKTKKNEQQVIEISEKYKELITLNSKYIFNDLGETSRTIYEKEYSHKAFDRACANDILIYHIENNKDNIREYILNAYKNKKMYDDYLIELNKIMGIKTNTKLIEEKGINENKFYKNEQKVINKTKINESIYNVFIKVVIKYTTKSGKNNYQKEQMVGYKELCDLYMKWRNGKKYEETSKRERKYMNDKLRYDILKRDNFKCQKCGTSANDGAKLHVDHIIPVSKGGQTTPSNLQTLCDRCNIGKSNKTN